MDQQPSPPERSGIGAGDARVVIGIVRAGRRARRVSMVRTEWCGTRGESDGRPPPVTSATCDPR